MLMMPDDFIPGFTPSKTHRKDALWFVFCGNELLIDQRRQNPRLLIGAAWPVPQMQCLRTLYMGSHRGRACYAVEVARNSTAPEGMRFNGLREAWALLEASLVGLAGQAIQLIDWDRCHQYCGRCGEPMTLSMSDRSKRCSACGLSHYPRIAPAVMVRIIRNGAILLARSPRFPPGRYSVLAGFVDPGESLEQTVHREVMEEVGLKIKNLRYLCSQPWPFPHSLMIAFSADHAAGEISIDGEEIEDAGWYTPGNLPDLPPPISIARRLIDDYLQSAAGSKRLA